MLDALGWIFIAIGVVLLFQAFFIGRKLPSDTLWKNIPYLTFAAAGTTAGAVGVILIDWNLPPIAYSFPIIVAVTYIIMLVLVCFRKSNS